MSQAGAGVTVGVLDTGAWPEHPSFADQGNLSPRPGPAIPCNFGDNPLTPAADPFVCNNKLLGGGRSSTTYLSDPARAAAEPYHTARDSNGHGTHTTSTTAGNALASRRGVRCRAGPDQRHRARRLRHRVQGLRHRGLLRLRHHRGRRPSRPRRRRRHQLLDLGRHHPFTDPTELAFLDAYAAGVFVAASAGNEGPGAGDREPPSPWVTTVAASTQTARVPSTLTLTGSARRHLHAHGASITAGVDRRSGGPRRRPRRTPTPSATRRLRAGLFTGKIVACQRGANARVEKGFNVLQGGAAGMILYNPAQADVETDNHWLPTVHLADGTDFLAFMAGHTGVTGSFTAGVAADGQGDVMAAFSSRGPAGLFVKPDITAPGVQILAGHTPTPESVVEGPPGEYFQAIAGTSMSSPHIAGSAALIKALHPSWTPGPDQVGADDDGDDRRRQGGPRHAGRSVRLRRRPRRPRRPPSSPA